MNGDQGRLYQVLLNLLANSVKFTAQGSVVLRATPAGGDRIRFEIQDTGPGLPPSIVDRLFEPFVRADTERARRAAAPGSALPSAVASWTCSAARSGRGNRPRRDDLLRGAASPHGREAVHQTPPPRLLPDQGRVLSVLVAEDTPSSAWWSRRCSTGWDNRTVCVEDGRAAVEAVLTQDFDVVLMDMQMPQLDGVAATRAIRSLPGAKGRVPVVFLTAQALSEARQEASDAGTPYYLTKPTRLADLRAMLAAAVADAVPDAAPAGEDALAACIASGVEEMREAFDPATFRGVLARFEQDARERAAAIESALARGDATLLRKEAHKLAGVLGQVGLADLAAQARTVSHGEDNAAALAGAPALLTATAAGIAALARFRGRRDRILAAPRGRMILLPPCRLVRRNGGQAGAFSPARRALSLC